MITVRKGNYSKTDIQYLKTLLSQAEQSRKEHFCTAHPDCSTCPIRHICADLTRVEMHLEANTTDT